MRKGRCDLTAIEPEHLVRRLVEDERRVEFDSNDALGATYLQSYPEFIRYFREVSSIERHHLIIVANLTYGWIPRIVRF